MFGDDEADSPFSLVGQISVDQHAVVNFPHIRSMIQRSVQPGAYQHMLIEMISFQVMV